MKYLCLAKYYIKGKWRADTVIVDVLVDPPTGDIAAKMAAREISLRYPGTKRVMITGVNPAPQDVAAIAEAREEKKRGGWPKGRPRNPVMSAA